MPKRTRLEYSREHQAGALGTILMRKAFKKLRKHGRRRRYRRHRRGPPIVNLQRGMYNRTFGFPDRIITRLRYDNVGSFTSTTGAIAKQVYRMNSLFDPDKTGGGHQPLYYDQLNTVYDQYAVIKSRIRHTLVAKENNTVPWIVGTCGDDDGTTSTTFQTLMEKSHGHTRVLGLPTSGNDIQSLSDKFNCRKMLTIDPFTSETYKTAVGSDPTEEWDNLVWALPLDGATTETLYVKTEIIFTVLFTELKDVAQS